MKTRRRTGWIPFLLVITVVLFAGTAWALTPQEELGKELFFDANLSTPTGQSCASCHAPEAGWTGPDSEVNLDTVVYMGAVNKRFGNRKPPTAAYGGDSPVMYFDEDEGLWIGGMFWDGRATGSTLGDPLAEQAQGPFLNPLEQNNPHIKQVCYKVAKSDYADLFKDVWGALDCGESGLYTTYDQIAFSIAAYERSDEVNPFSSKYDCYLAGNVRLSRDEFKGLKLFEGKGKCNLCHPNEPGPGGEPPLFTDFSYDNLGVPKNPLNPFYYAQMKYNPDGYDWVDHGLGGFLHDVGEYGKHKVPTLRNVDMRPYPGFVKAYAHNGFFKSLKQITNFYNTRDVGTWPPPEYGDTVNDAELGDLGLTSDQEDRIVDFMKTLSDGYVCE